MMDKDQGDSIPGWRLCLCCALGSTFACTHIRIAAPREDKQNIPKAEIGIKTRLVGQGVCFAMDG